MIEKKTVITPHAHTTHVVTENDPLRNAPLFTKDNLLWMLAGLAVIAIGMFVMSGGKSSDPRIFDQKEVYSTTRITVAPILILIGLGLEGYAIFKKRSV